MSDDWKPGDLALCVRGGPSAVYYGRNENSWGDKLRQGAVYVVRGFNLDGPSNFIDGLWLVGVAGGWVVERFRKIDPLTDEERDEFLADIKQPVRIEA